MLIRNCFTFGWGWDVHILVWRFGYCCCSVTKSCLTLHNPVDCGMPSFSVPHHLPEFAQVHVHSVRDAVQPSHPLTPSSPAFTLSQHQGLFQWVSSSHHVVKVLELQLQHQYSGLISFRIDWFDLLAVQGTLKCLLQHCSSKASVLQCSAFCMVFMRFRTSNPWKEQGRSSECKGSRRCWPVLVFISVDFWVKFEDSVLITYEVFLGLFHVYLLYMYTYILCTYLYIVYNILCTIYILSVCKSWASLIAQFIKNSPAMQETLVPFLGW